MSYFLISKNTSNSPLLENDGLISKSLEGSEKGLTHHSSGTSRLYYVIVFNNATRLRPLVYHRLYESR